MEFAGKTNRSVDVGLSHPRADESQLIQKVMTMKVTETKVMSLEISELRDFDPIRVVTENYGPGRGRITITCEGKAWTGSWFAMSDRSV